MIKNKKIVITGAASGIGLELCKALSNNNQIFATDINKIQEINNIQRYQCDLSEKESIDKMMEEILTSMGEIDLFFSCAGFAYYEDFKSPDWEHIEKIFKTNVFSHIYLLNKIREIKKEKSFDFIIIASAMSFLSMHKYSLYSGTKFALKGFVDSIQYEMPKNQIIRVVYPIATIKTSFFQTANSKTIPWPRQTAKQVAVATIRGITKNKKNIFPSLMFQLMIFLNRFFPIFKIYLYFERKRDS